MPQRESATAMEVYETSSKRTDLGCADDGHVLERVTDAEVLDDGEAEDCHHGRQAERRRYEERRRQTEK